MAYELRMSDELHDWLADLAVTDPATARPLAEALTALLSNGAELGAPVLAPLTDPSDALDEAYQHSLENMQDIRCRLADMATTRQRLAEKIARKGENPELRRQLDQAVEAEQRLEAQSRREQTRVDTFRARKEVLKARRTATLAQREVYSALAGLDLGDEEPDAPADFEARLRDIEQEIQREISQATTPAPGVDETKPSPRDVDETKPSPRDVDETEPSLGDVDETEPSLRELRTGASGDDEIHVLFAIEPPEAVLLIAVVEGEQAWRDHQHEAIELSAEVLRSAHAGQAPESATRRYNGARPFLTEFFPADADEIEAAAANPTS